ncbi:hypothetical protein K435DRAFT_872857 [Dendrothele bispora CBS 962.96]|uniref:Uncharacterized protein n=1 Tax=Dendrothele bispora (strain CBS 962.96) TaxID=1314807 RepID=A0A4S8L0T1_DENBC|nr:hypothetical protein K435DRAFT_872857 [Dendrothele bispora CBS 962.96]
MSHESSSEASLILLQTTEHPDEVQAMLSLLQKDDLERISLVNPDIPESIKHLSTYLNLFYLHYRPPHESQLAQWALDEKDIKRYEKELELKVDDIPFMMSQEIPFANKTPVPSDEDDDDDDRPLAPPFSLAPGPSRITAMQAATPMPSPRSKKTIMKAQVVIPTKTKHPPPRKKLALHTRSRNESLVKDNKEYQPPDPESESSTDDDDELLMISTPPQEASCHERCRNLEEYEDSRQKLENSGSLEEGQGQGKGARQWQGHE